MCLTTYPPYDVPTVPTFPRTAVPCGWRTWSLWAPGSFLGKCPRFCCGYFLSPCLHACPLASCVSSAPGCGRVRLISDALSLTARLDLSLGPVKHVAAVGRCLRQLCPRCWVCVRLSWGRVLAVGELSAPLRPAGLWRTGPRMPACGLPRVRVSHGSVPGTVLFRQRLSDLWRGSRHRWGGPSSSLSRDKASGDCGVSHLAPGTAPSRSFLVVCPRPGEPLTCPMVLCRRSRRLPQSPCWPCPLPPGPTPPRPVCRLRAPGIQDSDGDVTAQSGQRWLLPGRAASLVRTRPPPPRWETFGRFPA